MNEVTKLLLSSQVDENVTHKLVEHLTTRTPSPALPSSPAGLLRSGYFVLVQPRQDHDKRELCFFMTV